MLRYVYNMSGRHGLLFIYIHSFCCFNSEKNSCYKETQYCYFKVLLLSQTMALRPMQGLKCTLKLQEFCTQVLLCTLLMTLLCTTIHFVVNYFNTHEEAYYDG